MTINLYHIKGYRPYKLSDLKITYNTLYMIKSIKIQKKLVAAKVSLKNTLVAMNKSELLLSGKLLNRILPFHRFLLRVILLKIH